MAIHNLYTTENVSYCEGAEHKSDKLAKWRVPLNSPIANS